MNVMLWIILPFLTGTTDPSGTALILSGNLPLCFFRMYCQPFENKFKEHEKSQETNERFQSISQLVNAEDVIVMMLLIIALISYEHDTTLVILANTTAMVYAGQSCESYWPIKWWFTIALSWDLSLMYDKAASFMGWFLLEGQARMEVAWK